MNLERHSEDPEFERLFKTWVRWCKSTGRYQNRSGSAEGRWNSPQIWEPLEPRAEPIDLPGAFIVNRAYCRLVWKARLVIKVLWFRDHWRPQWQAQKIGCRVADLPERGYWAKRSLRDLVRYLRSQQKACIMRSSKSN